MGGKKHQLHQPLSTLYKFFKFIMKSLASQIFKLVTLGWRTNGSTPPAPPISDAVSGSKSNQIAQTSSREYEIQSDPSSLGSSKNNGVEEKDKKLTPIQAPAVNVESSSSLHANKENSEQQTNAGKRDEKAPESSIVSHAKAPEKSVSIRKAVSINDRVEDIGEIMKKKKKSKSLKKSNSLEYEEDGVKPLRSILKVGSNLDEKTDSSVNQNTRS